MENKLPEGWEWKTIESLCKEKMHSGGTPRSKNPKYYEEGTIPWVITADMTEAGMYISRTKKRITQSGYDNSSTRMFPKGTILFSMYGSIGKVCITKIELCTNQAILGIIPDNNVVLTKYLYYCLKSLTNQFMSISRGGTQNNINAKMVKEHNIPVPKISIQKAIVKKLDLFFEEYEILKEEKQRSKHNNELIVKSVVMKIFFPEKFDEGWKIVYLDEEAEIIMGQSPPSSTYNTNSEGLPFFQGKKEFGEKYPKVAKYCSDSKKIAEFNDTLLSVRAPVGSVNMAKERCCIGRGLAAIRSKGELSSEYIYYFMKGNEYNISFSGRGSTFDAIGGGEIKKIKIPVPPNRKVQKEILKKLKSILDFKESIIEYQLKLHKDIGLLPHSVLTKAFKGELIS